MLDAMVICSEFLALARELSKKRRIIGPVPRSPPPAGPPPVAPAWFYEEVEDPARIDLSFPYGAFSPRAYLFPPAETLFTFDADAHGFTAAAAIESRPTAFIGVHPCDLHAIRLLDAVFSGPSPDEHYLARRRNTLIVGVDCPHPCTAGVFCADMKTNEASEGFDVMLYPLGVDENDEPRYGLVFGSKAGAEWLRYSRRCTVPTAADERRFDQYLRDKAAAFPRVLTTPLEGLPDLLDRSYDSLLWEATARRCYSCGSCNLSCPTCYCFNIADDIDLSGRTGRRRREWDGCQLREFAVVAGGHNFRPQAAARLRHRIYRKARWIRERTGLPGCVGCARCDRACTAKINSVEIYNQLAEEV